MLHILLQGRIDDNIDTIKTRLKVFEALNLPVVDYYAKRGKLYRVTIFSFNILLDLGGLSLFKELYPDNLLTKTAIIFVYHLFRDLVFTYLQSV